MCTNTSLAELNWACENHLKKIKNVPALGGVAPISPVNFIPPSYFLFFAFPLHHIPATQIPATVWVML